MQIKINGKNETVQNSLNLGEIILGKGLTPEHIVVEHNYNIIAKEEWDKIAVKDNDNIEIISFVGGG
ncbi:MAG: sulfur carrier protein ThiS [Candidatus Omnitrophota bacterium]|jgi:sulfur carrier protein